MADEDDASKTEDPTDKKLSDARNKGQVASSQEVKNLGILLAVTAGLMMVAPNLANDIRINMFPFVQNIHSISVDFASMTRVSLDLTLNLLWALAPIFALLVVASIFSNIMQSGIVWAPSKVKVDWSKISLKTGTKRMFSMRTLMEFLKGVLKLLTVGLVAFGMAIPLLKDIELIPQMDFLYSLDRIQLIAVLLASGTIAVMVVIAGMDFAFQKHKHSKEMRMTKQEVKDEQKQSDGDPQVKAKIRQIRSERARQRMMSAVPEADVVITNPTHYSIALKYNMEAMAAPKLVAKGLDHVAFRIREVAEAHDIPLVENAPLARALYASVELDEEIPPEHFQAVAEVIGYVMRMKGKLPH